MGSIQVMGDLYNSLFATQISNPEIMVDYKVWSQIKRSLPANYTIPGPNLLKLK
jgi:hypothetical protein